MKTLRLMALMAALTAGTVFGQVSVGIRIGPPPAVRVEHRPKSPGADYLWIDGYWYADGKKWKWHNGYWTRPPYEGAHWVAPRHENGMFFDGYWEGGGRQVKHDHKWDRDHNRDYDRH